MDLELVIKIAVIGIVVAVVNQILSRCGRDDYAMLTSLAGILAILFMLLPALQELMDTLKAVFSL